MFQRKKECFFVTRYCGDVIRTHQVTTVQCTYMNCNVHMSHIVYYIEYYIWVTLYIHCTLHCTCMNHNHIYDASNMKIFISQKYLTNLTKNHSAKKLLTCFRV